MHYLIAIASWIAGALGWFTGGAYFVILAVLARTAIALLLPVIIYNAFAYWHQDVITWVMSYISPNMQPVVFAVTGLAGWLADCLNLAQIMTLILSAIGVRFVVSFFVR